MATGSSDTLPRLADALSEVGVRLREISEELRGLQLDATPPPVPAPEPPPVPKAAPAIPKPAPSYPRLPEPTLLQLEPTGPTLWERASKDGAGSRILAWVGGVVTLAGVVLLLVLAIQRGYLGPLSRVLLGGGLGLALTGIGMGLHRNPNARTGAYALVATGIAGLYLDVIAATTLHELLLPWAGLVIGLMVAAGGIGLAARWDSQLLAVFVVVCCAVSAPILTDGFVPLLLSFLLVLQIATTPAQLVKRWGGLCLAAGLPPVLATFVSVPLAQTGRADTTTIAVLCLVTSVVQVALATVTSARQPGDEFSFGLLLIAPTPTMLGAILLPKAGATVLPAAIAALLIVVWSQQRTGVLAVPAKFAMAAGGAGALAAFQATATAFDGNARAIALLGEALLLALVALRLRYSAALLASALFGFAGLVLTLGYALPPNTLVNAPRHLVPLGTTVTAGLTGLLLAVAAIALCWVATRLGHLKSHDHAPHGWIAAAFVALYGASGAVLSVGLLISPDRSGFLLGHVFVTVSWTLGALALLLRGIDSVPLRVAGLALVAAALVKLVLFDLSSLDGIARVAAFLVAGLVLLAAGTRYARLVAARGRHART
jgi:uncharacterized membrane protein